MKSKVNKDAEGSGYATSDCNCCIYLLVASFALTALQNYFQNAFLCSHKSKGLKDLTALKDVVQIYDSPDDLHGTGPHGPCAVEAKQML